MEKPNLEEYIAYQKAIRNFIKVANKAKANFIILDNFGNIITADNQTLTETISAISLNMVCDDSLRKVVALALEYYKKIKENHPDFYAQLRKAAREKRLQQQIDEIKQQAGLK